MEVVNGLCQVLWNTRQYVETAAEEVRSRCRNNRRRKVPLRYLRVKQVGGDTVSVLATATTLF